MAMSLRSIEKFLYAGLFCFLFLTTSPAHGAEAPQKLRVAYAAITAAFSIPWIAKEAGIFQRHGLDVELVYIAAGSRGSPDISRRQHRCAAIGGSAGVDAKLAGADTVYIAIPVNRVIVFTVAAPQIQRIEQMRGKSIGVTRIGARPIRAPAAPTRAISSTIACCARSKRVDSSSGFTARESSFVFRVPGFGLDSKRETVACATNLCVTTSSAPARPAF